MQELYFLVFTKFEKTTFMMAVNRRDRVLYETMRKKDVDMTADLLIPAFASDSKGVRLIVK